MPDSGRQLPKFDIEICFILQVQVGLKYADRCYACLVTSPTYMLNVCIEQSECSSVFQMLRTLLWFVAVDDTLLSREKPQTVSCYCAFSNKMKISLWISIKIKNRLISHCEDFARVVSAGIVPNTVEKLL